MGKWARYLTPTAVHRSLGLVCLGVGTQASTERLPSPRVLDCHAAVLVTHGSGDLTVGARSEPVRVCAPTLFWLRPGTPHLYGPDPHVGWTESWLLFDGPAVEGYESLGYLPTGKQVFPLRSPMRLMLVLERLAATCRGAEGDVDVVAGSLVHEFVIAAREAVRGSQDNHDERILAELRREALNDMSIADRAARVGVSTRELRTIVQRSAGCSATQFVRKMRVNRAKELLAETDSPVTDVALAVGFSDPAYFSRYFRASVGMPPREFRRLQQQFLG